MFRSVKSTSYQRFQSLFICLKVWLSRYRRSGCASVIRSSPLPDRKCIAPFTLMSINPSSSAIKLSMREYVDRSSKTGLWSQLGLNWFHSHASQRQAVGLNVMKPEPNPYQQHHNV